MGVKNVTFTPTFPAEIVYTVFVAVYWTYSVVADSIFGKALLGYPSHSYVVSSTCINPDQPTSVPVQKIGFWPLRVSLVCVDTQVDRYGERTARGTAGGRRGVNFGLVTNG